MGEKARVSEYDHLAADSDAGSGGGRERDEFRMLDWEVGLPTGEDLSPLSLLLVPPELASAFRIPTADFKTVQEVNRASQLTVHNLRRKLSPSSIGENFPLFIEAEDPEGFPYPDTLRQEESMLDDSPVAVLENAMDSERALKRPRLVWTPQLHKRFVDVISHLGIKNVVPKSIMQLMNVEGLTRENVASHLQKYRLYLKRMDGYYEEGPSTSDHLFASAALPQNIHEQLELPANSAPAPVTYTMPAVIPMPIYSIPRHHSHEMYPFNNQQGITPYTSDFAAHLPYLPSDWSSSGKFGTIFSYPHASRVEK